MRQGGGDGDRQQGGGEGADNGRLMEGEDFGEQEKCVAIVEHHGGLRSEKPWKESCKCDGTGELNDGKHCHGEIGNRGDSSSGEKISWGECNCSGEKMVGSMGEGNSASSSGEKMVVRENVRLKLALVECRLLLHDQVTFIGRNNEQQLGFEVNDEILKESQLSQERRVADARLATITAQLARFTHQKHQSLQSSFASSY